MAAKKEIRVLLVEDDPITTTVIKRELEISGYLLAGTASNGREAVKKVIELRPDVVLMDILMPDMDGLEATQQIQEKCPTPVVVLTSYKSEDLVEKAGHVGASAYLIKPPSLCEIDRAVAISMARHSDLLELQHMNRQLTKQKEALEKALEEIKTLRGFLPICARCKKIKDVKGYWRQVEDYISEHTKAEFTHGICPECKAELYPEYINVRKK
ncbi:MAG: response regulator [bacterium]|nr:response regulator [bacterium]